MCPLITVRSQKKLLKKNLNSFKSSGICDKPVKKSLAGFFGVLVVALPGVESGILEGTSKAKSDGPGVRALLDDGSEIVGGLLGGLAAG